MDLKSLFGGQASASPCRGRGVHGAVERDQRPTLPARLRHYGALFREDDGSRFWLKSAGEVVLFALADLGLCFDQPRSDRLLRPGVLRFRISFRDGVVYPFGVFNINAGREFSTETAEDPAVGRRKRRRRCERAEFCYRSPKQSLCLSVGYSFRRWMGERFVCLTDRQNVGPDSASVFRLFRRRRCARRCGVFAAR